MMGTGDEPGKRVRYFEMLNKYPEAVMNGGEVMRRYREGKSAELLQVTCNHCGKELRVQNGILTEGCYHGKNVFDFFSEKDGICEEFDLCELCYEKMISEFMIPVTRTEVTELL